MPTALQSAASTTPSTVVGERGIESSALWPYRRASASTALFAFGIFLVLNYLCVLLEPGAYFLNSRRGLNMPEKVGMFLLRKPRPDILFMGSSRPCLGFHTDVAQRVLNAAHEKHTIMNMAVVATTFDFSNVLLKNWILPNNPPKVIIYGCSEFDLFGNEIGHNRYRSLWRNMPYIHTLTRWDDWQEYKDAELTDQIEFVIDQIFPFLRDRKVFRDAICVLCHISPIPLTHHPKDFISGKSNEFPELDMQIADSNYVQFLPAYDMSKPNTADMERFIQLAQSKNIKLIFVNMPVTKRFRGYWKDGGKKIQQYRDLIASICARHNIRLVDYYDAPPDVFDPKIAFRDTNHLSRAGACVITEKVVNEALIPVLQGEVR